jgi:RNA polymerase sigma factor for flagellar operon FliA
MSALQADIVLTPAPYVTLTAYWRWQRYTSPAPPRLAVLLDAVRGWLLAAPAGDWTPVRSALARELPQVRAEIAKQPASAALLDACLRLDVAAGYAEHGRGTLDALQLALIAQFTNLARSIARQIWDTAPARLELDELGAIANEALVAAARRWRSYCTEHGYDPEAPYFQWFATQRIRGAIYDALRTADWVTRTVRGHARALRDAENGVPASAAELAARTGLSLRTVSDTRAALASAPVSLEAQVIDVSSERLSVESHSAARALLTECVRTVRTLPVDAQTVVVLKYYAGLSLDEIAHRMDVPKALVSQWHITAVLAVHAALQASASDDEGE